jgi:hypothetical protein
MPTFARLPTAVHRAAIAGVVVDAVTGGPVAGVEVVVTKMPPAFQTVLTVLSASAAHPDRTVTAADGGFRFVDLPDGAYTLSFTMPHAGHRYGGASADFTVARDGQGNIPLAVTKVTLPPTGVRGQIESAGAAGGAPAALPLARARVDDGCAVAYADANGRFYLTGVEAGARRLVLSASGFAPTTVAANITEGQVVDVGPVVLNPQT